MKKRILLMLAVVFCLALPARAELPFKAWDRAFNLYGTYMDADDDSMSVDKGVAGVGYGVFLSPSLQVGIEARATWSAAMDSYVAGIVARYYRPIGEDVANVPLLNLLPEATIGFTGLAAGYGLFDSEDHDDYGGVAGPVLGVVLPLGDNAYLYVEGRQLYYDDRTAGTLGDLNDAQELYLGLVLLH